MPVETFFHQPHQCASDQEFIAERDLIFDNDVENGVHLYVGQPDERSSMILCRKPTALALVKRQPLFRLGRLEGIVALYS